MNSLLRKIIPVIPELLKKKRSWASLLALLAVGFFASANVTPMIDWMWKDPRDLLVDRVEDARDSQQAAAEQFRDALTEFRSVVALPDTDLERQYKRLNAAHKRSQAAADDISKRIDRVSDASNGLLAEWRSELGAYNDPELRRIAQQQYDQTRVHATRLIASMRQIEQRMRPVLASFQDQVLYLKHNLNLSAIAALEGEATVIETNVDVLIADMNRAIAEADAFIEVILNRDRS
jgi:hypothetical protein